MELSSRSRRSERFYARNLLARHRAKSGRSFAQKDALWMTSFRGRRESVIPSGFMRGISWLGTVPNQGDPSRKKMRSVDDGIRERRALVYMIRCYGTDLTP